MTRTVSAGSVVVFRVLARAKCRDSYLRMNKEQKLGPDRLRRTWLEHTVFTTSS